MPKLFFLNIFHPKNSYYMYSFLKILVNLDLNFIENEKKYVM